MVWSKMTGVDPTALPQATGWSSLLPRAVWRRKIHPAPQAVKAAAPLPPHPRPPFPTSGPGRWSSDGATPSGFPGERSCRHLGALSFLLPVSHPTSSITPLSRAEGCGGGGAQSIGKGQRAQNLLGLSTKKRVVS